MIAMVLIKKRSPWSWRSELSTCSQPALQNVQVLFFGGEVCWVDPFVDWWCLKRMSCGRWYTTPQSEHGSSATGQTEESSRITFNGKVKHSFFFSFGGERCVQYWSYEAATPRTNRKNLKLLFWRWKLSFQLSELSCQRVIVQRWRMWLIDESTVSRIVFACFGARIQCSKLSHWRLPNMIDEEKIFFYLFSNQPNLTHYWLPGWMDSKVT